MSDIKDFIAKFTPEEGKLIRSAYEYAEHILAGRMRENGDPFITHPINVAYIVSNEIGLMADAVAAVFLHEGSRAKYMQQQEREDMSAFLAIFSFANMLRCLITSILSASLMRVTLGSLE